MMHFRRVCMEVVNLLSCALGEGGGGAGQNILCEFYCDHGLPRSRHIRHSSF